MTVPFSNISEPWVWSAKDYQDNMISITVNWDTSDGSLMNAVVFRDPECVYTKILIGIGPDGTPDTTQHQWVVPNGETLIRASAIRNTGLMTIYDVMEYQITAGF